MRLRRLLLPLFVLALIAAACGGGDDDASADVDTGEEAEATTSAPPTTTEAAETTTTTEAPATTTTTEAPLPEITPVGDGPYVVGVQTITVEADHREAPITVDVWFPLLDGTTGDEIMEHLFSLQAEHGATLILVTHSKTLADRCDRVIRLRDGTLEAE